MRSFLTVLGVGLLICGFAAAANAQAFLGFDKNIGDPNPNYPPQYYKAGNTSGPGWMKMGGGAEFKPSFEGYDKNAGDPNPNYPPQYYKVGNTSGAGWMNMGGSK
jgi:hypothetical protein